MATATELVGVYGSPVIFLLKIAICWAAFKIGSIEAVAVAAPSFKDPAQVVFNILAKEFIELFLET